MPELCSKCGTALTEDAKFCPQCGTPVRQSITPDAAAKFISLDGNCISSAGDEGTVYDVFLSYSHRDRDTFGMEYILRIRDEIESSLNGLVAGHAPKVFLDAEALHLGELWHSKIMASLRQCKVFVCLVSDEYLNSDYCARERLWWDAQQTRDGRFLDRPYPVYFVKLADKRRDDAKDLMAVEMDREPWFETLEFNEFKKELQEMFIRERLDKISAAVKNQFNQRHMKSYCSVLPPLHVNFVGRITELRELYEHCANGKYPVIQAFGGVGKTELSVAYAYGFADRYPMGRFLFRMEGVTSWDEAFAAALEANGITADGTSRTVFEELNIGSEDMKKDRREHHQMVANAFLERAKKGQLLILLDNLDEETTLLKPSNMRDFLCDSKIPGNIHILATTRGSFQFSKQESFLSYELKNLKEDEAFEMLCLTGNGLYPFDKQPPNAENEEYQAAREVIRLLDGHAWSMEIISAFMADNYLDGQYTFAMELAALRKANIMFISSEVGGYREKENAATSVKLLQPTLDKLATLELGEEIMELAVFAACFDPDEIPMYLLREYWEINFPDAICSCGVPFIYAVNRLVKYHLLRKNEYIGKMHRLVQSTFLSRKEKYLPKILKTIPKCSFIPAKYWVPLLLQNPELIGLCPQDGTLDYEAWAKLLADPGFAEKCPRELFDGHKWSCLLQNYPKYVSENTTWGLFNGDDWVGLLKIRPHLGDQCDWSKLSGFDWASLLEKQPQFAEKCDWSKLDRRDWVELLEHQPQFIEKCDWSELDGGNWAELLKHQPQFADKCDWGKLNPKNWKYLLYNQPQFADKCDWDKLNSWDWAELLGRQPQFAGKCDWNKLYGADWQILLKSQPRFADKCDWNKLNGDAWGSLLEVQPQFADKCDWNKLYGVDWQMLLKSQPQFADKCDWSKLDGGDWACLLEKQPQFANKCNWSKLNGRNWAELLKHHPQFAAKCDWSKLNGGDWARVLEHQPQFIEKCDWSRLDGGDWAELLIWQPRFADKCDWSKLAGDEWRNLLSEQPQFADKCDWSKLDGGNWAELLACRPQFADKCDWSKLKNHDWAELLGCQPQFWGKCDWSELDGWGWADLLINYPQFADKCDWDKLDGKDWAKLLEERPEFADECDLSKLNGKDLVTLLYENRQFADKCDWSKLDGGDWSELLIKTHLTFADKCDWSKLNGRDWAELLIKIRSDLADRCNWNKRVNDKLAELLVKIQQLFADKCDWSKLNGENWAYLLDGQPQFAKYCDLNKLSKEDRRMLLEQYPQLLGQGKQEI
ncbi:MAG: TIR domain-containing protein [Lentisphaeria bacterium]|nr:TIR domain-containing protein [Lentisphaeria bacterium]